MTWTIFDALCVGSWDHFLEFQTKTSSGFQGLFLLNYMAALKLGTRGILTILDVCFLLKQLCCFLSLTFVGS